MALRLKHIWPFARGRKVFSYCFAHQAVVIPPPFGTLVELGAPGTVKDGRFERKINAYEVVPDGADYHPFMAGTLGSFAVLRDLQARDAPGDALVNITHYRRFMMPDALGVEAKNYPNMRLVTEAEARLLDTAKGLRRLREPFLFSQPVSQPSIIEGYGRAHHREDLENFADCAIVEGVITASERDAWFAGKTLIPGGVEYGVSPVSVYVEKVSQLERVSRRYLNRHRPVGDDPYQRRALNFLCERLGSLLLERAFDAHFGGTPPDEVFGFMHIVSDKRQYRKNVA